MAWCCQAMILSSEDDPLPGVFDPGSVDPVGLLEEVARLSQEREGPRHAVARMRENGIRFVVLTHIRRTYLDGAAMRGPDGVPLVALTLRHDAPGVVHPAVISALPVRTDNLVHGAPMRSWNEARRRSVIDSAAAWG